MKPNRGIYLTCDTSPRMREQLRRCLKSIRETGCELPIHAILAGQAATADYKFLKELAVTAVFRPWREYPRFVRHAPTFLKWFVRPETFDHDELLFLDVDTFACRDLSLLFDAVGAEDLHARQSLEAFETDKLTTVGVFLIRPPGQLPEYLRQYELLRTRLQVDRVIGLNSGIMIFKNRSHERILGQGALFSCVRHLFTYGLLPYLLPHPYQIDELVARISIGALGGITSKTIPRDVCPYYVESFQANPSANESAIVVHTFQPFYAHYLLTHFGSAACQEYLDAADAKTSLDFASVLTWVWIIIANRLGLTRFGSSWRHALARKKIRRILRASLDGS